MAQWLLRLGAAIAGTAGAGGVLAVGAEHGTLTQLVAIGGSFLAFTFLVLTVEWLLR